MLCFSSNGSSHVRNLLPERSQFRPLPNRVWSSRFACNAKRHPARSGGGGALNPSRTGVRSFHRRQLFGHLQVVLHCGQHLVGQGLQVGAWLPMELMVAHACKSSASCPQVSCARPQGCGSEEFRLWALAECTNAGEQIANTWECTMCTEGESKLASQARRASAAVHLVPCTVRQNPAAHCQAAFDPQKNGEYRGQLGCVKVEVEREDQR